MVSLIQFSVKFSFAPSDITDNDSHECHFEGKLQLKFSLGVVQVYFKVVTDLLNMAGMVSVRKMLKAFKLRCILHYVNFLVQL